MSYLIREYDGDDEDVSQETHRQNDGAKDQRCCGDVLYARGRRRFRLNVNVNEGNYFII